MENEKTRVRHQHTGTENEKTRINHRHTDIENEETHIIQQHARAATPSAPSRASKISPGGLINNRFHLEYML
ncbi:MAG TPA: hypothetical protein ENK04_13595, partial [Gammaproteobacteria bacterium]|nr:hypothetical protein [Gammaproteobacteria bacterium]